MKTYFECWIAVATALFSQALAGEPTLAESLPKPLTGGSFGWAATLSGDVEGRLAIVVDAAVLETPLVGEGADQKAGWAELIRETFDAAAGDLLAATGARCRVERCEEIAAESKITHAFQLRSGERSWTILALDAVQSREGQRAEKRSGRPETVQAAAGTSAANPSATEPVQERNTGFELLLDVELEASLRFGSREMLLGEILDLGPGDVVELDRRVADPVDLIVGDKIVARGEVVLVNGNFGLRVSDLESPRKRLESVRCLF